MGSNAVLSVQAVNADSYQWLSNGVAIEGQTNSSLVIEQVGIEDAGSYSCNVSQNGGDAVPTRAASLNVVTPMYLGGNQIIVFGFPKFSNGTLGTCPGHFVGYINYTKTIAQGWGWAPSTNTTIHTASDTNRADTKIVYTGKLGDSACGVASVTIPNPPASSKYRFTVYFPNHVPTNSYPIVLGGFDP